MQHSVSQIGKECEELSRARKERNLFLQSKFLQFAREKKGKYHLIENGDNLLVSTWYSDGLQNDFKNLIRY